MLTLRLAQPSTGFVLALFFLLGCASVEGSNKEEKLAYMGEFEAASLAWLLKDHPDAKEKLDAALGYAVIHQTVTKVPMVGAGGGYGVTYDRGHDERVYYRVRRLDLGMGWGLRNFRLVILFNDQESLDSFKRTGIEFEGGAEATAKAGDVGGGAGGGTSGLGFDIYTLTDGGVSATATLRGLRYKVIDL